MSETIERYGIQISAKVDQALEALKRLESQNKKTKDSFEKAKKEGADSANALGGAFDNLKGKLLGLLAVGAFTSFIKKLAESNLQIKIMADRLGMTAKNVKGMQQAFKSVGQDESLANASMEEYSKSYAVAKYKGQLTGSLLIGAKLGVSANDARGNQKDVVDFQSEVGQAAVRKLGGRENAIQWLTAEGMDSNLAAMITKEDYKEMIRLKQEEAVVSDKAAETAKKWADFTERFNNRAAEAIERLDDQIGLWDGLNKTLDLVFDIGTAVYSIMEQLGQTFMTVGTICENIGKVLESLFGSIDYEKLANLLGMDDQMADAHQALAGEGFSFDIPETHQPTEAQMAAKNLPHGAGKMTYTPGKKGSIMRRLNPGNVRDSSGKIATFGSIGEGLDAQTRQVARYRNAGFSLREMIFKYAPFGDGRNNPQIYTNNVAKWAGVNADVPMSSLSLAQMKRVAAAMIKQEHDAQPIDPRLISDSWERNRDFRGKTRNRLDSKTIQQIIVHNPEQAAKYGRQVGKTAYFNRGYR